MIICRLIDNQPNEGLALVQQGFHGKADKLERLPLSIASPIGKAAVVGAVPPRMQLAARTVAVTPLAQER